MRKFSILLVDDEELAIRGIETGVNWSKVNIEKVYKAHNRDTAIRMLSTYEIDIVLSDIEMPNGNGLELIQWIRENREDIMCMFYTGHAEFSYAQMAVKLGVEDYLLKPIPYEELERLILNMEEKIDNRDKNKKITEVWDEVSKDESEDAIENVKRFIVEHIDEELQRDVLAASVNMTPNYLSRLFRKQEGMSLSEYILKKRVAVAKQLLEKTNLPITIISERVGITYPSYFTKIFREHENMTPQKYREQFLRGKT